MGRGQAPGGRRCEECEADFKPPDDGRSDGDRTHCPRCAEILRAREREPLDTIPDPPTAGAVALVLRGLGLRGIEGIYHAGIFVGSAAVFALGGFVPVLRGWLRDEVEGWAGVVEALGGVRVVTEVKDPDADLGPVLARTDASALFEAVGEVARKLGARPPEQIRLSYLPCCGVVAWRRSRALMLGLPLLHVLTLAELRAVLAHELAHLARGDATHAARASRFVQGLSHALDGPPGRSRGPLRSWARLCRRGGVALLKPIARGQEARADRCSAAIAGGDAAASALVKVAMVQPLFREVLGHYDPTNPDLPNLYEFFRDFWLRLPESVYTAMRHQILANERTAADDAHPPLLDRLAIVQSYPILSASASAQIPASTTLGDLETLERMLHNRLFGVPAVEPTVFHKAGS